MFAGWNTSASSYSCGAYDLMYSIWNVHQLYPGTYPLVTEYEVWNEPDFFTQNNTLDAGYNGTLGAANSWSVATCSFYSASPEPVIAQYQINSCGGDTGHNNPENGGLCSGTDPHTGQCGPLEAAGLFYTAAGDATELYNQYVGSGFPTLQVAALTMSSAENVGSGTYGNAYFNQMLNTLGQRPAYWAVHDYNDTTSTSTSNPCGATYVDTCDLKAFEHALTDWVSSAQVWVTESGVRLDNPFTSDDNGTGPYPPGPPCLDDDKPPNSGDPGYPNQGNDLGGCVDGHSDKQQAGTRTWQNLAHVTSGTESTTEVFWYEWKLQSGLHSFDSAMTVPSVNSVVGRASYYQLFDGSYSDPPYPDASDYEDYDPKYGRGTG
jgi:hypothetical protein